MLSLMIDAHEGRDTMIFDVPGAYLQADMEKFILLRLEGNFVDIMCDVDPALRKHVIFENGKQALYLQLLKALYGCMESALLWYDLYHSVLLDFGFTVNKYDKCVANRMVNGQQQTICWYVDDNKISHMDRSVNEAVIAKIEERFGELTVQRGRKFVFLGMNIEITADHSIKIDTKEYIQECIDAFDGCTNREVNSPHSARLFKVNGDSPQLSNARADAFHSITAKLLWIMKRARPDIETPISFLCTRVQSPNEDDNKKLQRVLQFLRCTIDDVRVIRPSNLTRLVSFVDAAYGVHDDMRSHTGGCMSFGLGMIHCKLSRQRLNAKSSTESEVIGVSDYVPYLIWVMHFLEDQGYPLQENVLYQDNMSAIKMEKMGETPVLETHGIYMRGIFLLLIESTRRKYQ